MGIFLILAGVVFGLASLAVFGTAQALPQQLFAGEVAICGAILFGAGACVMSVDRLSMIAIQVAGKFKAP